MRLSIRRLAATTVVLMYIVLVMGALVTNTGSSDGCGTSWPLCNGRVFPIPDFHALVEYGHRIVVSVATVFVLALAVAGWLNPGPGRRNRWFAALAVAGLFAEAAIGAAAVMWPQPTALLATHFGLSLLSYSGVFLLALSISAEEARPPAASTSPEDARHPAPGAGSEADREAGDSQRETGEGQREAGLREQLASLTRFTWILLLYTVALIYSGAYVRHDGSFCGRWPLCEGGLVPPLHSPEFPQFAHRLLAGLALLGLVILWRMALSVRAERPDLARGAGWALAFGVMQTLSGVVVVRTGMSVMAAMLHAAIIPLLFSAELYLALQLGVIERGARAGGRTRAARRETGEHPAGA